MANTSAPRSARYTGLFYDAVNGRMDMYYLGTLAASYDANDFTAAVAATVPQALTIGGIAYTFPADNGDAGEQLQTDGSGVLTWEASGV